MKKRKPHSKETKIKISKALMGHKHSKQAKIKISKASKLHWQNLIYREKVIEAQKRKKLTEIHKRKIGLKSKGRKHSEEAKLKISRAHKGRKRSTEHGRNLSKALKGRKLSEETKRKIGLGNKGKFVSDETKLKLSKARKEKFKDPKFKKAAIKRLLKGLFKRPTSLEEQFIKLIKKYNLSYKYTGDGSFLIGFKNPDFININHEKICIEVRPKKMCRIWDKISAKEYKQRQIKHYAKYGWKCIVVWQEDFIRERINLIKLGL